MRAEADEDDEDEELGLFFFTVIDGRRKDGRVSLRIREEMKDLSFKELKNFDRRMGDVGMT